MSYVYQSEIMEKYGMNRPDVFKPIKFVDVEPITVWRTFEDGHNHWQEGHIEGTSPKPLCEYQEKKWKNRVWGKSFRYILWYTAFNPIFPWSLVGRIV